MNLALDILTFVSADMVGLGVANFLAPIIFPWVRRARKIHDTGLDR